MFKKFVIKNDIARSLSRFDENIHYFKLTKEIKEENSEWIKRDDLYYSLPNYNLPFISKTLKANRYRNFLLKRAENLYREYLEREIK